MFFRGIGDVSPQKSAAFVPRAGQYAFGDNADKFAFVPDLYYLCIVFQWNFPAKVPSEKRG